MSSNVNTIMQKLGQISEVKDEIKASMDRLGYDTSGGFASYGMLVGGAVESVSDEILSVRRDLYDYVFKPEANPEISTGYFINYQKGAVSKFTNSQHTDFIGTAPGEAFMFNSKMGTNIAGYALYDSDKVLLSSLPNATINADANFSPELCGIYHSTRLSSVDIRDYVVQIPKGCSYIRFSSYLSSGTIPIDMNVRRGELSVSKVAKLEADTDKLLNDVGNILPTVSRLTANTVPVKMIPVEMLSAGDGLPGYWYISTGNIQTSTTQTGYSVQKYEVSAGLDYRVNTCLNGQTGIFLFEFNDQLSTASDNVVSCIYVKQSGEAQFIYDQTLRMPIGSGKYILGVTNYNYGGGASGTKLSSEVFDIVGKSKVQDQIEELSSILEKYKLSSEVEASEVLSNSWYTKTATTINDPNAWAKGYYLLKYVVEGGKTYRVKTGLQGSTAIRLFTYNDQLSTDNGNSVSVIISMPYGDVTKMTFNQDIQIPGSGKYILGVSTHRTVVPVDEVYVIDIDVDIDEKLAQFADRIEKAEADISALSAVQAHEMLDRLAAVETKIEGLSSALEMNDAVSLARDAQFFDDLLDNSPSAWTDGVFDKAKLVFTVDDGRPDAGYIAQFLSSEYGFPMCFAVTYNSIACALIQSYVEDNGDGTSSTYECGFPVLSDMLLAEEAFGGETYAHDSSQGRWMLSVEGQANLVPKFTPSVAEYYFVEIKNLLKSVGLKVDGFVSPWHDNLDCYAPQLVRHFKYARWSTRSYPNLPYQIPYIDASSQTLAAWKTRVDALCESKKLLMLYTHGIGGGSSFKMKDLKAMFDYVKEKVDAGLLDVTTLKALYPVYGK